MNVIHHFRTEIMLKMYFTMDLKNPSKKLVSQREGAIFLLSSI